MSRETKQAEQPNEWTNGQTGGWTSRQSGQNRWTAGGTAERMDKRTVGRADRADRTGQSRTEQTEQTEQDEQAERRSRQAKQTGKADRQSRQTADSSHRHSEDSQNTGLNHVAGEKKRQSRPGETGRERRPGAETGSRADGSGSDGSGSDGSGSAQKTIRNQRTIISVCPSALTLCDARQ